MLKCRLKHKLSGEIIECMFSFGKDGERIFYDVEDNNKTYNADEYENIPLSPFELFGVECKNGWRKLYEPIIDYVNEYNKNKGENDKIEILQIKEKWGYLDLHLHPYTDELKNMCANAHKESANVCEDCGSTEDVGMAIGGWYHTICLKCLLEEVKNRNFPYCWHRNSDNKNYMVYPNGQIEEYIKKP